MIQLKVISLIVHRRNQLWINWRIKHRCLWVNVNWQCVVIWKWLYCVFNQYYPAIMLRYVGNSCFITAPWTCPTASPNVNFVKFLAGLWSRPTTANLTTSREFLDRANHNCVTIISRTNEINSFLKTQNERNANIQKKT